MYLETLTVCGSKWRSMIALSDILDGAIAPVKNKIRIQIPKMLALTVARPVLEYYEVSSDIPVAL